MWQCHAGLGSQVMDVARKMAISIIFPGIIWIHLGSFCKFSKVFHDKKTKDGVRPRGKEGGETTKPIFQYF